MWLWKGFGQAGVRRRPVIAKDGQADRILGMISQLDVIKWLSNRRREFSPAFEGISIQHVVEVTRWQLYDDMFLSRLMLLNAEGASRLQIQQVEASL